MREIEILFRGKRIDNGEWVCGDLLQDVESGICAIVSYVNLGGNIHDLSESCIFAVIPETVGQYTGLTDKNGKRIFEGDIVSLVKHDGLIYKVVYVPCRYELVNSKGVNCFVLDIYKSENIEVIGNIHDNPELLGGENNGINR